MKQWYKGVCDWWILCVQTLLVTVIQIRDKLFPTVPGNLQPMCVIMFENVAAHNEFKCFHCGVNGNLGKFRNGKDAVFTLTKSVRCVHVGAIVG